MFQRIPLFGACEGTPWGSPSQGDLKGQGVTACLCKAWKVFVGKERELEVAGSVGQSPAFQQGSQGDGI